MTEDRSKNAEERRKSLGSEDTASADSGRRHSSTGPSDYKFKDQDNRRKAKFMLAKLLPLAEKRAAEGGLGGQMNSDLGRNSFPHYHFDRLDGVHIHPASNGGWYFDLSFKDLPPGVPDAIGTPVALPLQTREEAEDGAVTLIAMLIGQKDTPPPSRAQSMAVFPFDEVTISIPSEAIGEMEKLARLAPLPSREYALNRLHDMRRKYAGGSPITEEVMNELGDEARQEIFVVAVMAMISGIVRFPENDTEPWSPSPARH